jgi:hypothetical protein
MEHTRSLRWVGLLLLAGVVVFSIATIIAEPFEQESATELYNAIAANVSLFRTINLLATVGVILLLAGFFLLAAYVRQAGRLLFVAFVALLAVGALLWAVEVFARITTTVSSAQAIASGGNQPSSLRAGMGVGFDPVFLGFLIFELGGIAVLVWSLGRAGLLSSRWALIGALVVVVSGVAAALFYPWVGGVERALFYPLFLVVLPLALYFLIRRPALAAA